MELGKPQIIEKINDNLSIHIYDMDDKGKDLPEVIYGFVHKHCAEEMLIKESTLKKLQNF